MKIDLSITKLRPKQVILDFLHLDIELWPLGTTLIL